MHAELRVIIPVDFYMRHLQLKYTDSNGKILLQKLKFTYSASSIICITFVLNELVL